MKLTVTQNVNKINVTVTQSNTVIELQPILNNTGSGSGGGAVDSVNGQTGVVVLTADNIPETGTKFWLTDVLKTAYDSTVTWIITNGANLLNHLTNTSNPHNVTASQVGAPSGSGTSTGINTGDNATNSQYSGLAASKEDTSNKSNSDADIASTTKFPTWNAIWSKVLSFFQPLLVSGTNIKTYYSTSILGSGELANQKTVSGNVTLDNTYNGAIVKVKTTATITIPNGLASNFNCVFDVWAGVTATFAVSGGASIDEGIGTALAAGKMATLYQDAGTNVYRLRGELS